jgi:hypothetical protein
MMAHPDITASPGRFRVVEIDVRAATGFSGDPDDCARTISEGVRE